MVNIDDIKVEILRYPKEEDWFRMSQLTLGTVNLKPIPGKSKSDEWKRGMLKSEHSPIRTLMFTIRMEIPYFVSVHLCRHKYGVEHFVQSQRNDRQNEYNRLEAPQDKMVVHHMDINVQALMTMSRRRLCGQADKYTRYVMLLIYEEISKVAPLIAEQLVPMCLYRNECCEVNNCGFYERYKKTVNRKKLYPSLIKRDIYKNVYLKQK